MLASSFYENVVLFLQLRGYGSITFDKTENKYRINNVYIEAKLLVELANKEREKLNLKPLTATNAT